MQGGFSEARKDRYLHFNAMLSLVLQLEFCRLCCRVFVSTAASLAATAALPGDAVRLGRTLATRMRGLLDRQQYEVVIQVGNSVCFRLQARRAMTGKTDGVRNQAHSVYMAAGLCGADG
jgi:hypothetical protein